MIIVFPMLVSRAVSENAIPGIAKMIENYIIINFQDMIINNTDIKRQSEIFGKISYSKGNLHIKESEDLLEAGPPGSTPGTKGKEKSTSSTSSPKSTSSTKSDKEEEYYKEKIKQLKKQATDSAKEKLEKQLAKKASVAVKAEDIKSITLDPTYINVEKNDKYGNKSSSFIGVKVIPVRVKSDVKLSHLLLHDTQLKFLNAKLVTFGRWILRKTYTLFDKWTKRFGGGGITPSGDPRRDILMGRTGLGKGSRTFIVLSKQEDIDELFLDNIKKINRLFNMGWGNFVIADDIGRSAYFCMKEFKGMCNVVPYAMMYQYLGQSKAYETMEDAKKASSSIFKVGKRFSKVLGEWRVINKLYKYSQLNEDNHNE